MTPTDAQAYCTTLTKKSGSNFYYSFLFLPKRRRDAMYTVYAFCKAVDSAVDVAREAADKGVALRRVIACRDIRKRDRGAIVVAARHRIQACRRSLSEETADIGVAARRIVGEAEVAKAQA